MKSYEIGRTNFLIGKKYEGKVRDVYKVGNYKLAMVATDDFTAFDRHFGIVPFKGQVLNELSAFWFQTLKEKIPNHFEELIDPNISIVRELNMIPLEVVLRNSLTGSTETSIFNRYKNGQREFGPSLEYVLQNGLRKNSLLQRPIVEFFTKAPKGKHDELISMKEILERGICAWEDLEKMVHLSELENAVVSEVLGTRGLMLADFKGEYGIDLASGKLIRGDEIGTPDNSRIWDSQDYLKAMSEGREPYGFDKEYARLKIQKTGRFTKDTARETALRYIKFYEKVTGKKFEFPKENPIERMERNLRKHGYLKEA